MQRVLRQLYLNAKIKFSALTAREIFKGKVLETAEDGVREIAAILAEKTQADIVQIIGTKFVLYRKNNKEPKITLPKK